MFLNQLGEKMIKAQHKKTGEIAYFDDGEWEGALEAAENGVDCTIRPYKKIKYRMDIRDLQEL